MEQAGSSLSRRSLVQAASALVGAGALAHTPLHAAPAIAAQEATPVTPADSRLAAVAEQLDALIPALLQRDGTPGMTLAVTNKDGILFTREYGLADLRASAPMTAETRFEFGSIGKTFTATLIMQLVEEGKIDLHAPVTDYLPWFSVQSDFAPITPHDLLTHTSGLIYGSDFATDASYEVYALRNLGVSGPPGAAFHYSNAGYKALGLVVEAVTGKPYRQVIQERILDPLQMSDAANAITSEARKNLATGYWSWYDDRPALVQDGLTEATWVESSTGDGSLIASPSVLTAFLRMLLNAGAGPAGAVLSADSVALMCQPMTTMDVGMGFDYGYAIMSGTVGDQTAIGHTGGMLGYLSAMFGLPELGIGVIAMVNGPGDPVTPVLYSLEAIQAALAGEALPPLPAWPDVLEIPNAADFAGTFSGEAGEIRLETSDIGLNLVNGDVITPLQAFGPDTFLSTDPAFALFVLRAGRNDAGEVVELTHGPAWYRGDAYDGPTTFDVPAEWQALPGHYRSYNPWKTNFRVGLRKGELWLFWRDGREEQLTLTPAGFQPAEPPNTPLRLSFDAIVEGKALRVRWNDGDDLFYRFFTP